MLCFTHLNRLEEAIEMLKSVTIDDKVNTATTRGPEVFSDVVGIKGMCFQI